MTRFSAPQAYSYNTYGELETLTTWRDTAIDFSTAIWPNPTAGSGDVTTWAYQPATGLLTRKQYADTNGTDYTYDSANRLAVRTWARGGGLDTTYSYDAATGELLNVNYEAVDTADITYTYDRLGRQASVTDATGTRSFTYDSATLQLDTETLDTTFYQGHILKRSYQDGTETNGLAGRSSGYLLSDSASVAISAVNYTYDLSGRLETVTTGTDTFTYGYTANSNLLASLSAPQHSVAYTYESNRNVMTNIDNKLTGATPPLSSYAYSYDALGRRADREQSGSAFTQTNKDTFGYNPRSEVTGSTNDVQTAAEYAPSYSYDQIGNRLTASGGTLSSASATYATNSLNQYADIQVSSLSSQPSHDLDGNLTSDGGTWTYTWNNENRLKSATNGTVTIDFLYDYQGRLVQKDDGTNIEVYAYDGWNRIATFDSQVSSLSLQASYLFGLDLSGSMQGAGGVGGLLKEGAYYPTYDANGNVMQKLDGTGATAMNVDYDPFGNIISGTLVGEYGFSTKPLIDGLDWYYYGFRYYDPETGRWPSRDPIGEPGGARWFKAQKAFRRATGRISLKSALLINYNAIDFGGKITQTYQANLLLITSRIRSYLLRWMQLPSELIEPSSLYGFSKNNAINQADILGLASPSIGEKACMINAVNKHDIRWYDNNYTAILKLNRARKTVKEAKDFAFRTAGNKANSGLTSKCCQKDGGGNTIKPERRENALRHCIGACDLARQLGTDFASDILECHEKHGGGPPGDTAADRNNNKLGTSLGGDASSADDCVDKCLEAGNNCEFDFQGP